MSERQMPTHTTPISDSVVEARNIQEAILCLARGLDDVLARLDAQPEPGGASWPREWGEWLAPDPTGISGRRSEAEADLEAFDVRQREITSVKEQLRTAVGEDAEALQARLRLLKDTDANHIETIPEGERYGVEGELIDLLPATKERMDERFDWAMDHELHTFLPTFAGDKAAAALAFSKGGAEWLYLGNREAIMQMPCEWRTFLVEDVAVDSQKAALEMSADIMKFRTSADKQVSIDNIQGMSEHG